MADQTFSQEQVDEQIANAKKEWQEKELKPLQTELDEVKGKLPKEPTDAEKALQQKENELFQKQVSVELKANGLEQFADVVNVSNEEGLTKTIEQLTKINNDMKINNSYQPTDTKGNDAYDVAKKQGDHKGMVKSIFGFKS
ncbi:hypothetical protein [Lentibacillus salicampi]|uniref:DUF4355 domain-containing protein n=1 Tax=Lentibacillus salicampi TaxID=175306 RepID=A0A4Y9ACW7_9BACI|nr:hypothetical protein [Lentibacillus salicampi]TFJ93643.1 hypothetical protein E4U82_06715 [Lentibacillus salicampi]